VLVEGTRLGSDPRRLALAALALLVVIAAVTVWQVEPLRDGSDAETSPATPYEAAAAATLKSAPRPAGAASDDAYTSAFERGIAAYNADDVEGAADAFEEAVRLAPGEPEGHINLGLVYMRMQRSDDGLRELTVGAELERKRGGAPRTGDPSRASDGPGTIGRHDKHGRDGRTP
jgi:hypothetical protein